MTIPLSDWPSNDKPERGLLCARRSSGRKWWRRASAGFAGSNYASNVAGVRALTAGASAQLLSENYPFGDGAIAPGVDQGASLKEIAA